MKLLPSDAVQSGGLPYTAGFIGRAPRPPPFRFAAAVLPWFCAKSGLQFAKPPPEYSGAVFLHPTENNG
ncbi:MAG TPA: hypothetical protein DF364_00635 [Ruminococcaceae bacterium]|nr:hypothetical protein [Oscillospiraceae bacterium]HCU32342.1 hypothetical protein [Oscillospiraceae bacterium]